MGANENLDTNTRSNIGFNQLEFLFENKEVKTLITLFLCQE